MPRLTALLLYQLHIGDGHTAIGGFAHVVNSEKRHLNGGQGFHQNQQLRAQDGKLKTLICPEFCGLVGQDWDKDLSQANDIKFSKRLISLTGGYEIPAQPKPTHPVPPLIGDGTPAS